MTGLLGDEAEETGKRVSRGCREGAKSLPRRRCQEGVKRVSRTFHEVVKSLLRGHQEGVEMVSRGLGCQEGGKSVSRGRQESRACEVGVTRMSRVERVRRGCQCQEGGKTQDSAKKMSP